MVIMRMFPPDIYKEFINLLPVLFFSLLLLTGCSVGSNKHLFQMPKLNADFQNTLLWPAPPEVPRYAFIGHIYGESNGAVVDKNRSTMSSFFAALAGIDENPEPLINLVQPQQITSDNNGRIYVADTGRQSVFVFDEKLAEFFIWDESSLNIPFLSPVGIVYAENSIWLTDSELSLVYQLNQNGELINTIGKGILNRPTGITFDTEGNRLFIADTADNKIRVFNTNGDLIDEWGSMGSLDGEFNHPTFIVYRHGELFVADSLNARIQVFDDLGNNVKTFGQRGLYVGDFSRPKGLAVDSDGNLYVAESYYDHVLIYNDQGSLLMSLGGSGFNSGQFSQPTGIWIDPKDRIFVSDMLNSRISVFQYLGEN